MGSGEAWELVTQVVGTLTITALALWSSWLAVQWALARYARLRARRTEERRAKEVQSEQARRWMEGHRALRQAEGHLLSNRFAEALPLLDAAIDAGHANAEVLGHRGMCLQALGFDLDAIDDMNRSIALEPNDSNAYFLRSLSKSATGDLEGALSDLERAVHVAATANEFQQSHDEAAKDLGYSSAGASFAARIPIARMDLEMNRRDEQRRAERPDLFPKTLADERRSNARRRAPPSA